MPDLLERIGVAVPVVQAGMGGGLAGHELAAAVSEAGGLGTIGLLPPQRLCEELASARVLTGKPLAVNLLAPFTRAAHWKHAAKADVVVTHWQRRPRRHTPNIWIATVGSADEARAAVAAGADAVIAQGVESGGHVRGKISALELLEQVRAALPDGFPVLLAGGIAEQADVRVALAGGAVAAVAGTRFLASDESRAHPGYKQRVVAGSDTLLTELFGMAWPRAPHRVLPNAATRRWLGDDPSGQAAPGAPPKDTRGPAALRVAHLLLAPLARRAPMSVQLQMAQRARSGPLDLGPAASTADLPEETLETHALYAGETVARIADIRPAADLVRELTP